MTPAEELREAAERIRQVASAANLGTWWADETEIYSSEQPGWVGETLQLDNPELGKANAAHMVLWQPTVALLVAELLDNVAKGMDFASGLRLTPEEERQQLGIYRNEIALAKAINAKGGQF